MNDRPLRTLVGPHEHPVAWRADDGTEIAVRGFYLRLNVRVGHLSAELTPEQALEFAAHVLEVASELTRQAAE